MTAVEGRVLALLRWRAMSERPLQQGEAVTRFGVEDEIPTSVIEEVFAGLFETEPRLPKRSQPRG